MNRRDLLMGSVFAAATTAVPLLGASQARAAGTLDPTLEERLKACSPKDALSRLQEGNGRFARAWASAGGSSTPEKRMLELQTIWEHNCQIEPLALAEGQRPFAAILSCADSRVEPDWLFACGSGELFQVRSAGNTAFTEAIASLEYAVSALGTPLILVLGHSECGAVQAAMASTPLTPLLEDLVKPIRASFHIGDTLTGAIQSNIRAAAGLLTRRSAMLEEACTSGRLRISSAYFDIATGVVTLL